VVGVTVELAVVTTPPLVGVASDVGAGTSFVPQAAQTPARIATRIGRPETIVVPQNVSTRSPSMGSGAYLTSGPTVCCISPQALDLASPLKPRDDDGAQGI
jgi:hypothetical protein